MFLDRIAFSCAIRSLCIAAASSAFLGSLVMVEASALMLPMLLILPKFMGVDGVWWSMPISDTIAEIVAVVMMYTYMKKFKKQHNLSMANEKH